MMRMVHAARVLNAAGLQIGQLRARSETVAHNERWHYVLEGEHWSFGWGDIAPADLGRARSAVGRGVLVVLSEAHNEPAEDLYRLVGPLPRRAACAADIARQARFAVSAEGGVVACDSTMARPTMRLQYDGGPLMLGVPVGLVAALIERA